MVHHRQIFAAIIARALLTLSTPCYDPDPFGTLKRLIRQPSHTSDVCRQTRTFPSWSTLPTEGREDQNFFHQGPQVGRCVFVSLVFFTASRTLPVGFTLKFRVCHFAMRTGLAG